MDDWNRQVLIKNIRDIERSRGGATALCEAARWNLLDEAKRLLDAGVDADARGPTGATPLMLTTTNSMAQLLVSRGADVNAKDGEGRTPLIWFLNGLAKERDAESYIKALIDAGADYGYVTPDGTSALTLAKEKYGERVTRLLGA